MRDEDLGDELIIPPSSQFVFWPGDDPPMAEEIRIRLADWGAAAADVHAGPEDTLWSFWFEIAEKPMSFLIWCERVAGSHLAFLETVRWRSQDQEIDARSAKWMVGVEGPISLTQPTVDYQLQLNLCRAIGQGWSPCVFDANAFQFRTLPDLRPLIETRSAPRVSSLYAIHRVRSESSKPGEASYWIHTHGLERAGVPDLELFDVPEHLAPAACELIEAVADLWIEFDTPPPETTVIVGKELEVAWRPWQAMVAERAAHAAGGWKVRTEEFGHSGYRAVLVAPRPAGWITRRWNSPNEALRKLAAASTTVYKTPSQTFRIAQRARERWSDFGMLFAGRRHTDWRFAVKIRFAVNGHQAPGEHLWFDVERIVPGRVLGRLVSKPVRAANMHVGDSLWHTLDSISDWRIFTPMGAFDADNAESLLDEPAFV